MLDNRKCFFLDSAQNTNNFVPNSINMLLGRKDTCSGTESEMFVVVFFFKNVYGDKSPFCGATDTLCFELWLTMPMGVKARVDASSPALCSHLCVIILRVNSEFPGLGLVPILHFGMVRLLLE